MNSVDWNQLGGAAALLGVFIAALVFAVRTIRQDAAAASANAIESWKSLAEGRWQELTECRDDLVKQSEVIGELQDLVHARELEVEKRETVIAGLEARPDTEKMLATFERHHEQNQLVLQKLMENQTEIVEGLKILVSRNRDERSTDR